METSSVHRVALIFLCAIAVLPILSLPGLSIDADQQKGIFAAIVVGMALVSIGVLISARRKRVLFTPSVLFLSGVPMLLVALISFGAPDMVGYFGMSFETMTVGSLALFAFVFALFALIQRAHAVYVLTVSAAAVAVYLTVTSALFLTRDAPAQAKPSARVSQLILASSYLGHPKQALLGTAQPDSYAWYKYHLRDINSSPLWLNAPASLSSTAFSAALRWGLMGFVSFLLLFASLVVSFLDARKRERFEWGVIAAHVYATLLLVGAFFLNFNTALYLAIACALGCATALSFDGERRNLARYVAVMAGLVMIGLGGALAFSGVRQFVAAEFHARVVESANMSPDTKVTYLELAVRAWPHHRYLLEASKFIYSHQFSGITPTEENSPALLDAVTRATDYVDTARKNGNKNFEMWLYRASLYTALIPFDYPDAVSEAQVSLEQSLMLSANRPEAYYVQALWLIHQGMNVEARKALSKSLELKPDYAEALRMLSVLNDPTENQVIE